MSKKLDDKKRATAARKTKNDQDSYQIVFLLPDFFLSLYFLKFYVVCVFTHPFLSPNISVL